MGEERPTVNPEQGRPTRRQRMRGEAARVRRVGEDLLVDLRSIRPESRTVSAGFLFFERDREFPTSLMVGGIAARIVIFVIPFYLLLIFGAGLAADAIDADPATVAGNIGLPELFIDAASDSAEALGGWRLPSLALTILGVLWAANGLARAMDLASAVAWRSQRPRRRRRWLAPVAVLGVGIGFSAINAATSAVNGPGAFDDLYLLTIELILIGALWLGVSRYLAHDPGANRWKDFLPGAVLLGAFAIAMKAATTLYLAPKWGSVDSRYGNVGAVLVLMAWAYMISYAAVGSVNLDAALYSSRLAPLARAPSRSWPLYDLLRERWHLWRGRERGTVD